MKSLRGYNQIVYAFLIALVFISGCQSSTIPKVKYEEKDFSSIDPYQSIGQLEKQIQLKYKNEVPKQWGEKTTRVKIRLATNKKVVALTFDACGGKHGSGFDRNLIDYLIREKVSATLFINYRWIDANYNEFIALSKNPLFEIENHGYLHRPLSVDGKSAYGIKGTAGIQDVINEVMINQNRIEKLTGRKPKYFRPGTAYSDEVAVKIVRDLGEQVVGFNVLGDAGATFTAEQIKAACSIARPGSIIICHMNHPEKQTAAGIKKVVPLLREKGFKFVKLDEFTLE